MNKFFTIFSAAVMLVFSGCISADSGKAEKAACGARGEVKLLLPERIYAAHGVETNIYFENIICDEVDIGISFDGIADGRMENIHIKNISMNAKVCMTMDSVNGLYMHNVHLNQRQS